MHKYLDQLKNLVHLAGRHPVRKDRTGVGTTSVFGVSQSYTLSYGFPLVTTKRIPFRVVATELVWFLSGRTDNQWLNERDVTIWDEWATPEACARFGRPPGDLGPIYGFQWRHFGAKYRGAKSSTISYDGEGHDQIASLCHGLAADPNSRRHLVTAWNPIDLSAMALQPCHALWQVYVEDGKLDLCLYQRSADLMLGVPFNIACYALLAELLAFTHGFKARRFIHNIGDMHLYSNHVDKASQQLLRNPKALPSLEFNQRLAGGGLAAVLDFQPEDVKLVGYDPHPVIKAQVAV